MQMVLALQIGMIEAVSHLIHRDYEAIVQDFVTLVGRCHSLPAPVDNIHA